MAEAKSMLKIIFGICSILIGVIAVIVFMAYGDGDWWHYILAVALILWGAWDLKKDRRSR